MNGLLGKEPYNRCCQYYGKGDKGQNDGGV